mmetsp:Transcript_60026/g.50884  ORF Transcript_60026/g.50884 Transcript_60026/m.50884 type:complete len:86 (-) Transcript_60026:90-347(-)
MGTIQLTHQMILESIVSFKKALEIDPNFIEAIFNLGNAVKIKGDRFGAIRLYKRAIKLFPKFKEAYLMMGFAYEFEGRYLEALSS